MGTIGCGAEAPAPKYCQPLPQETPLPPSQDSCRPGVSTPELLARHAAPFHNQLDFDPLSAQGFPELAAAGIDLSADEQAALQANGFVISAGHSDGSFARIYADLYRHHLPVYVSADSILEGVHRSYDDILRLFESQYLSGELGSLLGELRLRLRSNQRLVDPATVADVDLLLSVAPSLLSGQVQAPMANAEPAKISSYIAAANAATGLDEVQLFGVARAVDWTQFAPRGHYQDSAVLRQYFRAVKWLASVDVPVLTPDPMAGNLTVARSGFAGTLLLSHLFTDNTLCRWRRHG